MMMNLKSKITGHYLEWVISMPFSLCSKGPICDQDLRAREICQGVQIEKQPTLLHGKVNLTL
jgi:hypothetical protein